MKIAEDAAFLARQTRQQRAVGRQMKAHLHAWAASYMTGHLPNHYNNVWREQGISIDWKWLTALAVQSPTFRKSFLDKTLATPNLKKRKHICVRFDRDRIGREDQDQQLLANANLLPTEQDYQICAEEIATYWNNPMPQLETLELECNSEWKLSLLMHLCESPEVTSRVKSIITATYDELPLPVSFQAFIGRFRQLETVHVKYYAIESFSALIPTLQSLSSLKSIRYCPDDDSIFISSSADATFLQQLLASSTLNDLEIDPIVIDTDEANNIVSTALMQSRIKHVYIGGLALEKEDNEVAVADAESITLKFCNNDSSRYGSIFWERMYSLCCQFKSIQKLVVMGTRCHGIGYESFISTLNASQSWKVLELHVVLDYWNSQIDSALVRHVRANKTLKKIAFESWDWGLDPQIQSKDLLEAITSIDSSVVSIIPIGERRANRLENVMCDPDWFSEVKRLLALKLERRMVRSLLAIPSTRGETESLHALRLLLSPTMSAAILDECLQNNYWNLQHTLVENYNPRKRRRDEDEDDVEESE